MNFMRERELWGESKKRIKEEIIFFQIISFSVF